IVVLGFAIFALALLAVRFIVFPQIESYRDTLAGVLSRQLGQPVEIAAINTGWDGWNPKLVVEGFRVLDRARANTTPLLLLPKLEIDPAEAAEDLPVSDWILRQREIVVRDALIIWDDDLRNAPQLVLDRVQFKLENSFGRLRFGLKGMPPAGLAAPIDVRGDLRDTTVRDWQRGEGRMFVRLDYADVGAWREWLPLPQEISSGKGAIRVWFRFADGKPREVVADLELRDVSAKLGD